MNRNLIRITLAVLLISVVAVLGSCSLRSASEDPSVSDNSDAGTTAPVTTEAPVTYKTEMVFDGAEGATFDTLCSYMNENPRLETLSSPNTTLTADEFITLCEINPYVNVSVKVSFEDVIMDLSQYEIDISGHVVSDREKFDTLLSHFPADRKLVMCDCGYTNEEMGSFRERYPSLKFAWRLYLGERWKLRTDDEAFSVMIYHYEFKRMTSEDIQVLKYCTNLYALDLGHQEITDISVIGEMKELRVLILADNKITDISPLAKLKNLQYLELFVNRISDLSPLAECTELVDLNFGWNRQINDVSCIYNLNKIERLWLPTTGVPVAARAEIEENFPGAKFVYADKDSISSGWRTHRRYYLMRGMFNENKYNPDFVS